VGRTPAHKLRPDKTRARQACWFSKLECVIPLRVECGRSAVSFDGGLPSKRHPRSRFEGLVYAVGLQSVPEHGSIYLASVLSLTHKKGMK
jgi:hypothetical protein